MYAREHLRHWRGSDVIIVYFGVSLVDLKQLIND